MRSNHIIEGMTQKNPIEAEAAAEEEESASAVPNSSEEQEETGEDEARKITASIIEHIPNACPPTEREEGTRIKIRNVRADIAPMDRIETRRHGEVEERIITLGLLHYGGTSDLPLSLSPLPRSLPLPFPTHPPSFSFSTPRRAA